jgi:hypothetical protein
LQRVKGKIFATTKYLFIALNGCRHFMAKPDGGIGRRWSQTPVGNRAGSTSSGFNLLID